MFNFTRIFSPSSPGQRTLGKENSLTPSANTTLVKNIFSNIRPDLNPNSCPNRTSSTIPIIPISKEGILSKIEFSCLPGFYCPNIIENDTSTLPQYYQPDFKCLMLRLEGRQCLAQGIYEPVVCLPGYYCPKSNIVLKCPEGFFCPSGTTSPIQCSNLSICPPGSTSPKFYGGLLFCFIIDIAIFFTYLVYKMVEKKNHQKPNTICRVSVAEDKIYANNTIATQSYGLEFEFRNLSYKTTSGETILDNISGFVKPGRVTCIMGPSGKTTMLNLLIGKLKITSGKILLNSREFNPSYFRKFIGFVPQEELTSFENIYHSARIRLPNSFTNNAISTHCHSLLRQLCLSKCSNTLIGSTEEKGVSGGERKRVSIALELVSQPLGIFLDEPTTGLDSTNAINVFLILKKMANINNQIVLCVIHQPSYEIFEEIDDIVLLSRESGKIVYFGPKNNVVCYFEEIGFVFRENSNPADILIDILSDESNTIDLSKKWLEFQQQQPNVASSNNNHRTHDPNDDMIFNCIDTLVKRKGATWITQFKRCFARSLKQQYRLIWAFLLEVIGATLSGAVVGVLVNKGELYKGVHIEPYEILSSSPAELIPRLSLFLSISCVLLGVPTGVRIFSDEFQVFQREYASGGHSTSAYYISKVCSFTPCLLIVSLHFTSSYRMISEPAPFPTFGVMYAIIFLMFFGVHGLSIIASILVKGRNSVVVAFILTFYSALLCGFGPTLSEIKEWPIFFLWELSFNKWGTEALFSEMVQPYSLIYNTQMSANNFGFTLDRVWVDLMAMFLIGVGYRIFGLIVLLYLIKK